MALVSGYTKPTLTQGKLRISIHLYSPFMGRGSITYYDMLKGKIQICDCLYTLMTVNTKYYKEEHFWRS